MTTLRLWLSALVDAALGWLLFAVLFAAVMLARAAAAETAYCPATFPECLNRDVLEDLADAGAESFELEAVERLMRHSDRGPVAYVRVSDREVALSWAHFTAGRNRLGLGGLPADQTSLAHYWSAMELLYSDAAGAVTLAAWRRLVGPVVREARTAGWPEDDLDLVAAAANSAPGSLRRIGRECGWERTCVVVRWATSERRKERMAP